MAMRPYITQRLIEKISSIEERILEKGTGISPPLRVNATCKLGCSTKIQAETLPLLIFQREKRITCHDITMIGKPMRKGLEIFFLKAKIFP
jgi:hypothetical protein